MQTTLNSGIREVEKCVRSLCACMLVCLLLCLIVCSFVSFSCFFIWVVQPLLPRHESWVAVDICFSPKFLSNIVYWVTISTSRICSSHSSLESSSSTRLSKNLSKSVRLASKPFSLNRLDRYEWIMSSFDYSVRLANVNVLACLLWDSEQILSQSWHEFWKRNYTYVCV